MPRIFDNMEKELLASTDVYDPGWVSLSSLCSIMIRGRSAVGPFSIEADPIGFPLVSGDISIYGQERNATTATSPR